MESRLNSKDCRNSKEPKGGVYKDRKRKWLVKFWSAIENGINAEEKQRSVGEKWEMMKK